MSEQSAPIVLPLQGVHQEINQTDLPPDALYDSENWIGRDGRMRVRRGIAEIGSAMSGRGNGFLGFNDGETNAPILLAATTDELYVFDDATQDWVALTATFTAGNSDHTIFEVFQLGTTSGVDTTVYVQNGVDLMRKWQYGDGATSNVSAAPVGKAMMILADRMLIGNIIDHTGSGYHGVGEVGPQVVAVSSAQDPEAGWNTTLIAQLADTPGAIVAMQEIGNLQGVIYKTDAIYLAVASGATDPFTFELKKAGCPGPVGPRAVVTASDGLQYYLALDGNVMVFDGIEPRPLGRHVQRYILNTWDIDASSKAHGLYDDENRELVFFYCGIGKSEPNRAIKIRLDGLTLWPMRWADIRITSATKARLPGGATIGDLTGDTIGDLDLTLGEYNALGRAFLVADENGQAYAESGHDDNDSPIPFFFETGSSDMNDPLRFKSVRYMDHLFATASASQVVSIAVKRSNYGEDMAEDAARTLDISLGGPYRTHHRYPGREYALKMSGNGTAEIEWLGSQVVYATQGRR